MEEKIRDYLLWKSSYAPAAARSYKTPLLNIRKLENLADVIEFKKSIEKKYSGSSQAYAMTVLRDFVKFLSANNLTTIPHHLIKVPRYTPKRRTVCYRDDVEKMLAILDETKFTELRTSVAIRLLADTGMRISELVSLNISDLEKDHAIIKTKKGFRERVVMWSDQTVKKLNIYLGTRICINTTSPLFISLHPKRPRITVRQLERNIKEIALRAGIKKNITPHTLRHGKAHDMLDKGANVKHIQVGLGHSELNPRAAFQYIVLDNTEQKHILKKYL